MGDYIDDVTEPDDVPEDNYADHLPDFWTGPPDAPANHLPDSWTGAESQAPHPMGDLCDDDECPRCWNTPG